MDKLPKTEIAIGAAALVASYFFSSLVAMWAPTILGAVGVVLIVVNVPMPQKYVWFLGVCLLWANALTVSLPQFGGIFTVLQFVSFWTAAIMETTGALALAIATYASVHEYKVSAHWFSLPTGCSFLSLLANSFPTVYIQAGLLGAAVVYAILKKQSPTSLLGPIVLGGAGVASKLGVSIPGIIEAKDMYLLGIAVAIWFFTKAALGGDIKLKLKQS